jgi:hypothetical protein
MCRTKCDVLYRQFNLHKWCRRLTAIGISLCLLIFALSLNPQVGSSVTTQYPNVYEQSVTLGQPSGNYIPNMPSNALDNSHLDLSEKTLKYLPVVYRYLSPTLFGVELSKLTKENVIQMGRAGTNWIRYNSVWWPDVEPTEGQYRWSALEELEGQLADAARQHKIIILIVRGTPDWAQAVDGFYCGPVKEEKLQSFANFMHDLVARYSVPPYKVKYWEILNEPDVQANSSDMPFGCWGDYTDEYYGGGYYADMLKMVYPEIKAANPDAQVILGSLLLDCDPDNPPENPPGSGNYKNCSSARYLEGILANGGGDYFDIVGFHAYDYYQGVVGQYENPNWHSSWNSTGPSLTAKANFIHTVLEEYGYADRPLMNTEMALLCYVDCDNSFEETKAAYLAEGYAAAKAFELQTNVWYNMYGGWRESGLVYSDGTPRPAYYAFKIARGLYGSAKFICTIEDYAGVMGYEYLSSDGQVWLLWSLDGEPHTITLPSKPNAMWNTVGESLTPSITITLGTNPVYFRWDK